MPEAPRVTEPAGEASQASSPEHTVMMRPETSQLRVESISTSQPSTSSGIVLLIRWANPTCSQGAVKICHSPSTVLA